MREERAEYLDRLIFFVRAHCPGRDSGAFYVVILTLLVTVHSVNINTLRDAQKSCIRMISRGNSRVFCELCSQKTPRGTLPVNSNRYCLLVTF